MFVRMIFPILFMLVCALLGMQIQMMFAPHSSGHDTLAVMGAALAIGMAIWMWLHRRDGL